MNCNFHRLETSVFDAMFCRFATMRGANSHLLILPNYKFGRTRKASGFVRDVFGFGHTRMPKLICSSGSSDACLTALLRLRFVTRTMRPEQTLFIIYYFTQFFLYVYIIFICSTIIILNIFPANNITFIMYFPLNSNYYLRRNFTQFISRLLV